MDMYRHHDLDLRRRADSLTSGGSRAPYRLRLIRRPAAAWDSKAGFVSHDHCLDPISQPELAQEIAHVGLDRVLADHQLRGDLRVGKPACDHADQDLTLVGG
jgi:hypothetical protein